jgi:hypothetical protein
VSIILQAPLGDALGLYERRKRGRIDGGVVVMKVRWETRELLGGKI